MIVTENVLETCSLARSKLRPVHSERFSILVQALPQNNNSCLHVVIIKQGRYICSERSTVLVYRLE
jgi:hypothetical protein